jgi:hypothetical protein
LRLAVLSLYTQIAGDKLTQLAAQHWSEQARAKPDRPAFSADIVEQIYKQELGGGNSKPPLLKRVMLLEVRTPLRFSTTAGALAAAVSQQLSSNLSFRVSSAADVLVPASHDTLCALARPCAHALHCATSFVLQVSQYLEGYLWPFFDPATATDGHVMSILVMVNEKFREGVPAWTGFHSRKVRNCQRSCSTAVSAPAWGFCIVEHMCFCIVEHMPGARRCG